MRIVITNAYTWGNKGDAGILLGTIDALLDIYGSELEVDILTFSPELDRKHYMGMPGVHGVFENVLSPYKPNPLHIPVQYLNLMRGIGQRIRLLFNNDGLNNESYKAIRDADYVIACGGGYLGGNGWAGNYLHLFLIETCLKLGKKVVMVGNSVEPSNNFYVRTKIHHTLSRLESVFAREEVTFSFLSNDIGLKNVKLIPDMAFILKPAAKAFNLRNICNARADEPLIGITVRKCSEDPNKVSEYISTLANILSNIIKRKKAHFVFIPQVRFIDDDDLEIAQRIKKQLDVNERFTLIDGDYSPREIKTMIGECDIFFGTRMHSNIFATSMRIPTVAIAYQKKTNGIMQMLGLSEYVINIDKLNEAECCHLLEQCMDHKKEISRHLDEIIPSIQKCIMVEVGEFLKKYF